MPGAIWPTTVSKGAGSTSTESSAGAAEPKTSNTLQGKIKLLECDLRDATSTREVIEEIRPDYIFHLAAQSFVPTSWRAPTECLVTNVIGQLNIFEAVRKIEPQGPGYRSRARAKSTG